VNAVSGTARATFRRKERWLMTLDLDPRDVAGIHEGGMMEEKRFDTTRDTNVTATDIAGSDYFGQAGSPGSECRRERTS